MVERSLHFHAVSRSFFFSKMKYCFNIRGLFDKFWLCCYKIHKKVCELGGYTTSQDTSRSYIQIHTDLFNSIK